MGYEKVGDEEITFVLILIYQIQQLSWRVSHFRKKN